MAKADTPIARAVHLTPSAAKRPTDLRHRWMPPPVATIEALHERVVACLGDLRTNLPPRPMTSASILIENVLRS